MNPSPSPNSPSSFYAADDDELLAVARADGLDAVISSIGLRKALELVRVRGGAAGIHPCSAPDRPLANRSHRPGGHP